MNKNPETEADRSIYQMPAFLNLVVTDFDAAINVYEAAGFIVLATIADPQGNRVLVHLRRYKYQDILIVEGTPAAGSATTSFAAARAELDQIAADLRATGVKVDGPLDTPWFSTDVTFVDHDGNRIVLTAARVAEDSAAREWINESVSGQFEVSPAQPDSESEDHERMAD